jgi:hypothetical protein
VSACAILAALAGAGAADGAEALPVSTQQVEDYEASVQVFWASVKSRMSKVCATA